MLGLRCCAWTFPSCVGAAPPLGCVGFSLQWLFSLRRTGSRAWALSRVAELLEGVIHCGPGEAEPPPHALYSRCCTAILRSPDDPTVILCPGGSWLRSVTSSKPAAKRLSPPESQTSLPEQRAGSGFLPKRRKCSEAHGAHAAALHVSCVSRGRSPAQRGGLRGRNGTSGLKGCTGDN